MNRISSIEQFSVVLTNIFARLSDLGEIALPYPSLPTPWNDIAHHPTFEADRGGRSIVPDWRFSCYPIFISSQPRGKTHFAGFRLSVNVRDATMWGRNHYVEIKSIEELPAALTTLVAFRDEKLAACKHSNHVFVANLGRCYNRYKCNDCGITFEIDSGD